MMSVPLDRGLSLNKILNTTYIGEYERFTCFLILQECIDTLSCMALWNIWKNGKIQKSMVSLIIVLKR